MFDFQLWVLNPQMRRKREGLHLSVLWNDEAASDNAAEKRNLYKEPFGFTEKEHSKEE